MASLESLKKEIQFNDRLGVLLSVMKSIASQQFQALEKLLKPNPAFFDAIQTIAATFNLELLAHPFTAGTGPIGIIAVTSDVGLLGGLNQQVILGAIREFREAPGELLVIGRRGVAYAREHGFSCREFPGIQEDHRRALAEQVRDHALNEVLNGRLGRLSIVYPRALSFTLQRVEVIPVLPCQSWLKSATVLRGLRKGQRLLMESRVERVVEYLLWAWLSEKLYEVFGSARLAELAARSVHLEGSTQELKRRRNKLLLRYFRMRHEVIDRGMRELAAARSLYRDEDTG